MITSPSKFVMNRVGGAPVGSAISVEDGACAFCGGLITAGELIEPTSSLDESFNNKTEVAVASSRMICAGCNFVSSPIWFRQLSKCLVSERGVMSLTTNGSLAHFIFNPPPPPFLAYVSTGQMQHVIWRSAVTHSLERIYIRIGERQIHFTIGRARERLADAQLVLSVMGEAGLKGKTPFTSFDRYLMVPSGPQVRPDVRIACDGNAAALAAIGRLEAMRLGEFWAVGILLVTDPEKIAPPELVTV